jgi:AraC family transcriptional regulator
MGEETDLPLEIDAEIDLPTARIQLVRLHHIGPRMHTFVRDGVYWVDLCLTPRRPAASGRYVDHWGPHRSAELGALIALPPSEVLELKSTGGRHASLLCQLRQESVEKYLPADFEWTDRRLEACLGLASEPIRSLLLRLNQELKSPGVASGILCEATTTLLAIELARYLTSVSEPDQKGGLASWRQRIIDDRVHSEAESPSVKELAKLCRISDRQLRRGFKASHGCSISEYLGQMRIEAAKRRLATSDSLKSVALGLGYSSQSSFTAAFRHATGTTPKLYRKRIGSPRVIGSS